MTGTRDARSRVAMVSFESLSRSTAAGNHIRAVEQALSSQAAVEVCGSEDASALRRYAHAIWSWLRRSKRGDVAYVRNHPVAVIVVGLARLRGQRVVLEVNGPPDDILGAHSATRRLLPVLRAVESLTLRLAESAIVPTPGLADYVNRRAPGRPVTVIPAGYDDDTFAPGDAVTSARYVAFVGANTVWQGVDVLLRAVRDPGWPEDVHLVLVGRFGDLDTSTVDAEHAGRVERAGVLAPADVARVLRGSLAALSPKTYQRGEGSPTGQAPLKVYEAMGCGVPCIVTDVPIQNELVGGGECGVVVPVGDHAAVARAVAAYSSDPELRRRHAENAAAMSVEYSWSYLAAATRTAVFEAARR